MIPVVTISQIEEAEKRVRPYIRRTPLLPFEFLGQKLSKEIILKCESLQRTGSFKIRGAANCILSQLDVAKKSGVIAASAGNHAQGVAAIAHILASADMKKFLAGQNIEAWSLAPAQLNDLLPREIERYRTAAKAAGIPSQ